MCRTEPRQRRYVRRNRSRRVQYSHLPDGQLRDVGVARPGLRDGRAGALGGARTEIEVVQPAPVAGDRAVGGLVAIVPDLFDLAGHPAQDANVSVGDLAADGEAVRRPAPVGVGSGHGGGAPLAGRRPRFPFLCKGGPWRLASAESAERVASGPEAALRCDGQSASRFPVVPMCGSVHSRFRLAMDSHVCRLRHSRYLGGLRKRAVVPYSRFDARHRQRTAVEFLLWFAGAAPAPVMTECDSRPSLG